MKKHKRLMNSLKRKQRKVKYILFDYDGVIADSLPSVHTTYKQLSKMFHFSYPHRHSKDIHESNWRIFLGTLGLKDKETVEALELEFHKLQKQMQEEVGLCRGIAKVIQELRRQGYALAICSGNYKDIINDRLKKKGIRKYFKAVLDYRDAEYRTKPDPILLDKAMKLLHAKPENTIYIGDMDGDILAARNANLYKVIAVTWGFHSQKRLKGADAVVHTPKDLITAIKRFDGT